MLTSKDYLCRPVPLFGDPNTKPGDQIHKFPSTLHPILFPLRRVNGRRHVTSVLKAAPFLPGIEPLRCLEGRRQFLEERGQIKGDGITVAPLMT